VSTATTTSISTSSSEPATQEPREDAAAAARPAAATGGRRAARAALRAPTGFTPLLRLIGLVAFAILVVVLLVFWVQELPDDQKQQATRTT
jgi:hypothetical protein